MPREPWYSIGNLNKAWKYARIDMRDDFVFDAIGYQDLKNNIDQALKTLSDQLQQDQYHPAPILSIEVPKSDHSFRPGTTIPVLDLVVLYAIAQQLAPPLDETLGDSAYAYRLNPKHEERRQALFRDKDSPEDDLQQAVIFPR